MPRLPSLLALALLLILPLVSGCDSATDSGTILLTYDYDDENRGDLIAFEFDSDDAGVAVGQRKTLDASAAPIDLDAYVRKEAAASREDIISAKLTAAEVRVATPSDVEADFLQEVVLYVVSDNFPPVEVATRTSLPSGTDTFSLALAGRELGQYAADTGFRFRLEFAPLALRPATKYRLTLDDLKLQIEVP